ncbi:MAG: hypothetical protein M3R00_08485 [Pseudomonadota bacterium]|nr:hypothetical protein [Pseudomonadota bacterium]
MTEDKEHAEYKQKIHENALFSKRLVALAQFKFTPEDLKFCNSIRPPHYIPDQLEALLKGKHGLDVPTERSIRDHLIRDWERMGKADKIGKTGNTMMIEITPQRNISSNLGLIESLKINQQYILVCKNIHIHITRNITNHEIIRISQHLLEIMSLSLVQCCTIRLQGNVEADVDFTPLLVVANLFCTELVITGSPIKFRRDIVCHLFKIQTIQVKAINEADETLLKNICSQNRQFQYLVLVLSKLKSIEPQQIQLSDIESLNELLIRLPKLDNVARTHYVHEARATTLLAFFTADISQCNPTVFHWLLESILEIKRIPTTNKALFNLIKKLLEQSLNRKPGMIVCLSRLFTTLISIDAQDLILKTFDLMTTTPEAPLQNDAEEMEAYLATFALAQVICHTLDSEMLRPYAKPPVNMSSAQHKLYSECLAEYILDYLEFILHNTHNGERPDLSKLLTFADEVHIDIPEKFNPKMNF